MTNEAIRLVLERPNRGMHEDIIITPISKTVWWGYIWGETDQGYEPEGYIQEQGFEFFFVKARDKKFAAAVFRMGANEIHWYVAEKYRGKRILVQPLKEMILPFIFKRHADAEQQATVDTGTFAKHSAKLARKVGFRRVLVGEGKQKFVVKRKQVTEFVPTVCFRMNESELRELEHRTKKAIRATRMIVDALRVKQFDYFEEALPESVDVQVEDALYALESLVSHQREISMRETTRK